MPDQKAPLVEDASGVETAEGAFRRIARQKLLQRGYPEQGVEEKVSALLRKGAKLEISTDGILRESS